MYRGIYHIRVVRIYIIHISKPARVCVTSRCNKVIVLNCISILKNVPRSLFLFLSLSLSVTVYAHYTWVHYRLLCASYRIVYEYPIRNAL